MFFHGTKRDHLYIFLEIYILDKGLAANLENYYHCEPHDYGYHLGNSIEHQEL